MALSRLRSRSKDLHSESFDQRLKMRLAKEKQILELFRASSQDVSLDHESIAKWSSFPLTADGNLDVNFHGFSSDQAGCMKRQINKFLVYDAAYYGGETQQVWSGFLRTTYPFMSSWPISQMLLALGLRVLYQRHLGNANLDFVEYYCGKGELSKAGIRRGLKGFSFDILLHSEHDALSIEGLKLYLAALSGTKPHAMVWHGTVCSSFTVLCRAQSLRTADSMFRGDCVREFVLIGNGLASVSALTIFISDLVMALPALEQPLNSCMPSYSVMNCVLTFIGACKISTFHGAFGAETLKPLQILSTSRRISLLVRPKPPCFQQNNDSEGLVSRSEDGQFTGRKENLVQSQAYTAVFGRAVIDAFFG